MRAESTRSRGLEIPCQNTSKDKPAFIKRLNKVLVARNLFLVHSIEQLSPLITISTACVGGTNLCDSLLLEVLVVCWSCTHLVLILCSEELSWVWWRRGGGRRSRKRCPSTFPSSHVSALVHHHVCNEPTDGVSVHTANIDPTIPLSLSLYCTYI